MEDDLNNSGVEPALPPRRRRPTGPRKGIGVPLPPGAPPVAGQNNPNRTRWEDKWGELLGKIPDVKLAKKARVAPETVAQERLRRGIPAFQKASPDIDWTPEMDARLGKDSDYVIGRELGVPPSCVSYRRRRKGVPAFGKGGRKPVELPPAAYERMGKAPDVEVGKEFGVSGYVVAVLRKARGIAEFQKFRAPIKWTAEMIARLDTDTDQAIADRYGIAVNSVVRKRLQLQKRRDQFKRKWTKHEKDLLGKFTDADNARRLGITEAMVKSMREHEGIPPLFVADPVEWTKEDDARLGNETDEAIASDKGCTPGAVLNRRQKLNIPSYRNQKRELTWSKDDDALLGTDSDPKVAKLLGRKPAAVTRRRLELGNPPFHRKKNTVEWNPDHDKVLGTMSDEDAAALLDVPVARARWRRRALKIPMFEAPNSGQPPPP